MKQGIKKKIKFLIGFIFGSLISGFAVYAATIAGTNVTYSTSSSSSNGATKTNVQDAIEELYEKAQKCTYLDNVTYKYIGSSNPTYYETQNKDATFGCFHLSRQTFSSDGILVLTGLAIKGNATESSIAPNFALKTYNTSATKIGVMGAAWYYVGYEEFNISSYVFKVKKGDYFDPPTCEIFNAGGRVAMYEYFLGL